MATKKTLNSGGAARSRLLVTLVHGTFAPSSAWTRHDSRLSQRLLDEFDGDVELQPFRWGWGWNSHRARLKHGRRLAATLGRTSERPHYLIAHSHGGNVALYALRECGENCPVDGVITLATPFLRARPRRIDESLRWFGYLPPLALALVVFLVAYLLAGAGASVLREVGRLGPGIIPASILGFVLAGLLVWLGARSVRGSRHFLTEKLADSLERKQAGSVQELEYVLPEGLPLLCIRAPGDEAEGYLKGISWLDRLPFWLWRAGPLIVGAVALAVAAGAATLVFGLRQENLSIAVGGGLMTTAVLSLVVVAFVLVSLGFMILWSLFVRGTPVGFGGFDIFRSWLVEVRPGHEAPAEAQYEEVPPPGRFRHKVYESREACDLIAAWLRRQMAERRRPPGP